MGGRAEKSDGSRKLACKVIEMQQKHRSHGPHKPHMPHTDPRPHHAFLSVHWIGEVVKGRVPGGQDSLAHINAQIDSSGENGELITSSLSC